MSFSSRLTQQGKSTPLYPVYKKELKKTLERQDSATANWIRQVKFSADPYTSCVIPDKDGKPKCAFAGIEPASHLWSFAHLPHSLPTGAYHIEGKFSAAQQEQFALGWLLATYFFGKYKKDSRTYATLKLPKTANVTKVVQMAESIMLARDLINTPANDMGPSALAAAAKKVAQECGAAFSVIVGDALLKQNYPAIHAVGRASDNAPRLIDIRWGKANAPKVTLVGKGVCFDSGGLDLKSAGNMKLMKKDMGGAACVLALARLIMLAKLPVRLRVLIPAVENSVSANAFRPMDIIDTRSGKKVEIGNTDAEGRLILCDALSEANSEKPELLIDCATLTGAARVALGTDIPAFFTNDDRLAEKLYIYSSRLSDPLWRLPLWPGYRDMINSSAADLNNAPDSAYGGAITAALYLKEFVPNCKSWLHVDMMAWNLSSRHGRPAGGEAVGVRALYAYIEEKFG